MHLLPGQAMRCLAGFLYSQQHGASDSEAMHFGLRAAQLSLSCIDAVHPDIASL